MNNSETFKNLSIEQLKQYGPRKRGRESFLDVRNHFAARRKGDRLLYQVLDLGEAVINHFAVRGEP
jgi:hypothetical protein